MPTPYTNAISTHIQLAGEADTLVTLLAAKMAEIRASEDLIVKTIIDDIRTAAMAGNYQPTIPAFAVSGQRGLGMVVITDLERITAGGQPTSLAELATNAWGSYL